MKNGARACSSQVSRGLAGWDVLLIVSLAGILASSYFAFFVPTPKKTALNKPAASAQQIADETVRIEAEADAAEVLVESRTWKLSAEMLSAEVLTDLNRMAKLYSLQVTDFRSGRITSASDLWEVTFSAVIEGSFLSLMKALQEIERADSKVAVGQLKLTSRDSGTVSASITLTGFIRKEAG